MGIQNSSLSDFFPAEGQRPSPVTITSSLRRKALQNRGQSGTHLFPEEMDRLRVYLGEALGFGDREEWLEERVLA